MSFPLSSSVPNTISPHSFKIFHFSGNFLSFLHSFPLQLLYHCYFKLLSSFASSPSFIIFSYISLLVPSSFLFFFKRSFPVPRSPFSTFVHFFTSALNRCPCFHSSIFPVRSFITPCFPSLSFPFYLLHMLLHIVVDFITANSKIILATTHFHQFFFSSRYSSIVVCFLCNFSFPSFFFQLSPSRSPCVCTSIYLCFPLLIISSGPFVIVT
jgi:hypothetical protein